ncbi:YkvA family protein [Bacillus sp. NEB1478]|uniref:YkvA family protein n=1 Tax=Bacillus sp. NEB1478 TaxID=3073816 RepID=UPI002872FAC8|nr:YkvA family protein [Bacillus sp. NEB1478]WNB90890.1 YkvA family protein [Bacillus sp. NEB1478]
MGVLNKLKNYAKKLKQDLFVIYLSYKDHRTPWHAKAVAICVVAYAFSPIDLIPDFIPVLGYLDDLIIVPLGISLALKLIPQIVIDENREMAEQIKQKGKPKNWFVGIIFIMIWILLAVWIGKLVIGFRQ